MIDFTYFLDKIRQKLREFRPIAFKIMCFQKWPKNISAIPSTITVQLITWK